jgi:putative ABC transport system substrate-binding protein
MKRFLLAIACLALSAAWSPAAGEAGVVALFSADIAPYRQAFDGFQEELRQTKGALRTIEQVLGSEKMESLAAQIEREKPLLVFTLGPEAAKFARERLKGTPVVFSMLLRPQPLAGPNVTWVSLGIPVRARLEKIRKLLPEARRIGVIYSPETAALYREIVQGCKATGLQAVGRQLDSGKELPEAFAAIASRIDLFLMIPDTKIFSPKSIEYLLVEGLKRRVPVIGLASSYSRAGALFSFEADYFDVGRQAGELAIRILDGESPGRVEPSTPRRIKTSVNLAVAERLGITIDPQTIKEASDVFK